RRGRFDGRGRRVQVGGEPPRVAQRRRVLVGRAVGSLWRRPRPRAGEGGLAAGRGDRGAQRRLGGEQVGGQVDGGGDAVAGGVGQADPDVVAGGEVAGHVVAQVLGGGDGEALDPGQAPVGGGDVGRGH